MPDKIDIDQIEVESVVKIAELLSSSTRRFEAIARQIDRYKNTETIIAVLLTALLVTLTSLAIRLTLGTDRFELERFFELAQGGPIIILISWPTLIVLFFAYYNHSRQRRSALSEELSLVSDQIVEVYGMVSSYEDIVPISHPFTRKLLQQHLEEAEFMLRYVGLTRALDKKRAATTTISGKRPANSSKAIMKRQSLA